MSNTTTTLAGSEPQIDKESLYLIDFSKLNSVNDLVIILSCIGFTFSPYHPHFEQLKPFLNLDTPIPNQRVTPPESKQMNLPKLKTIKK